jgi:hypothetical protein
VRPGHVGNGAGLWRAVAGVVLPDQRLAVHARGTSDGADVPARIEAAAASGEVVLFDPRMIVYLMQVRWLTCVMVRPAWRRAAAGTSPMLTRRLRCPIAPRTAYGAVAVTDSFSPVPS